MDENRQRSLLALLEWEERVERWLQVPPPDREAFVQEMAGLDGPAGEPEGEVR